MHAPTAILARTTSANAAARAALRSEPVRPRFDMYGAVHKGLRMAMADVLGAVGRMDPRDPEDLGATLERVRALLALCRCHLEKENDFVHRAMEAAVPGSTQRIAEDHVEHDRQIALLELAARGVEGAAPAAREAAANALYRQLALFVAENFEHMNAEETENNAVLWATYSDADLVRVHDALIASIAPDVMVEYLRWIVPAISPAERAGLYSGMQAGAPREVFEQLLDLARGILAERDLAKLLAALGPAPAR
jgi:hypothetical protein